MPDYYQILGVSYGASQAQIKAAYRRLALRYHPDRNQGDPQAEERFKQIVEAYQVLSSSGATFTYEHFTQTTTSKPQPPPSPRDRDPYFKRNKAHARKPPEPVVFSKRVKMMGVAFMVFLVVLVFVIPLSLQVYASIYNYKEAVDFYEKRQWVQTLKQLDLTYRRVGIRNLEAARLGTIVTTEKLKSFIRALPHINKGLRYAENAADSAFFYYKKGISLKNISKFEEADSAFHRALLKKPNWDSAYYYLGEVNTFGRLDYAAGIHFFTLALEENPDYTECFMGRGYCHYQRKNFEIAVLDFNSYLKYSDKDRGTGFYLRGMALLESAHPELACQDFTEAEKLGAKGASSVKQKYCTP